MDLVGLRVFQNNKALKLITLGVPFDNCLRVFQNNKALKRDENIVNETYGLRVFQNNKALKPQIRSKAHAAARLFCKISLPNLIRNVNRIANFA